MGLPLSKHLVPLFSIIGLACTDQRLPAAQLHRVAAEVRIPTRYVALLHPEATSARDREHLNDAIENAGGQILFRYTHAYVGVEFLGSVTVRDAALATSGVRAVYETRNVHIESDDTLQQQSLKLGTWGLDRLDQDDYPIDDIYSYVGQGEGVTAYVVDSGIRGTHQDFKGRVRAGIDTTVQPATVGSHTDCHGHGTHVAGIVGGASYGVAKRVSLVSVKVLNCSGYGPDSRIAAALDWILQNAQRPAVVNMSLGGEGVMPLIEEAVDRLIDAGFPVVIAGGNSGMDACTFSPARVPRAVTVASSSMFRIADQRRDGLSLFSNYGPCVDILAPGDNIRSSHVTSDDASRVLSGTSMAAPHVAGAVALYQERNPNASVADVTNFLLVNSVRDRIHFFMQNHDTPSFLLNLSWNTLPRNEVDPLPPPVPTATPRPLPTPWVTPPNSEQIEGVHTFVGKVASGEGKVVPVPEGVYVPLGRRMNIDLTNTQQTDADIDIYLYEWDPKVQDWVEAKRSALPYTSEESIEYRSHGTLYRVEVRSDYGADSYTLIWDFGGTSSGGL